MLFRRIVNQIRDKFNKSTNVGNAAPSKQINIAKTKVTPVPSDQLSETKKEEPEGYISVAKNNLRSFLSPIDDGQIYGGKEGKKPLNDWAIWVERTWECCCGHRFRAPGIWVPSEPAMCEAPGCPNPKFFTLGCNKHFLEAGNKGVITVPPKK